MKEKSLEWVRTRLGPRPHGVFQEFATRSLQKKIKLLINILIKLAHATVMAN